MNEPPGAILIATRDAVVRLPAGDGAFEPVRGLDDRSPTCLAAAPGGGGPAWCGTTDAGVYRSDDGGRSWYAAGLPGAHVTALTVDPVEEGVAWAGTEPSAVWRGRWASSHAAGVPDAGGLGSDAAAVGGRDDDRVPVGGRDDGPVPVEWERREGLLDLPSSGDWSFPPRPETHHVRWIACHPSEAGRLWVAVEAGALVWTTDGGATWHDRVDGSPHDTHELAIHPARPNLLRVAAGDGYFESPDAGRRWSSPMDGLEVAYLRSVAVAPDDPDTVIVSAASTARSAYAAFRGDGRLYRRQGGGRWERVRHGWPEPADTMAPLLVTDPPRGRILAADERGVHASSDGGRSWETLACFAEPPAWLRGVAVLTRARAS